MSDQTLIILIAGVPTLLASVGGVIIGVIAAIKGNQAQASAGIADAKAEAAQASSALNAGHINTIALAQLPPGATYAAPVATPNTLTAPSTAPATLPAHP